MDHSPAHDLLMNAAAVLLGGGGAMFIALSVVANRRGTPRPVEPTRAPDSGSLLTAVVVALAVSIAVIHLAAAPTHIEDLGMVGWGFVAATVFHAAWALAWLISPTRSVALWGIAGSLAIAAAWLLSRTAGLPVGPGAGVPEAVGLPDAVATGFGLVLAALLATRVVAPGRPLPALLARARPLSLIAAIPAVGLVVVVASIAVTLALTHSHAPGEGHGSSAGAAAEAGH